MLIQFSCSECERSYKVDEKNAGKKFKCKGCGNVVLVPAPLVRKKDQLSQNKKRRKPKQISSQGSSPSSDSSQSDSNSNNTNCLIAIIGALMLLCVLCILPGIIKTLEDPDSKDSESKSMTHEEVIDFEIVKVLDQTWTAVVKKTVRKVYCVHVDPDILEMILEDRSLVKQIIRKCGTSPIHQKVILIFTVRGFIPRKNEMELIEIQKLNYALILINSDNDGEYWGHEKGKSKYELFADF